MKLLIEETLRELIKNKLRNPECWDDPYEDDIDTELIEFIKKLFNLIENSKIRKEEFEVKK